MKHIYRRPLLPLLLVGLIVFSVCFMTMFQKNIDDDKMLVEELYDNAKLEFQILPGDAGGQLLRLDTFTGGKIKKVSEIEETCTLIWCHFSVREPLQAAGAGTAYGTDNISMLSDKLQFSIQWAQGYSDGNFTQGNAVPCLVEEQLLAQLELTLGQTIVIAPTEDPSMDPQKAPGITAVIAGSYTQPDEMLENAGIIVPEEIFLAKPGLLYNSNMMELCFYRCFWFRINPAYNREYEVIEEAVADILNDPEDFAIYSNAKSLEQMVRPIERKLAVQQMLILPLAVLLGISASVLALLLAMSFQTEVFLRFMWGEHRTAVLLKIMASVAVLLSAAAALAVAGVALLAGVDWLPWAWAYLCAVTVSCSVCAAIPVIRDCGKNLVKFYQSREG